MERIESSYFWKIVLKKGTWKIQRGMSRSNPHNWKFLLTLQFKLRKILKKEKHFSTKLGVPRCFMILKLALLRSFCLAVTPLFDVQFFLVKVASYLQSSADDTANSLEFNIKLLSSADGPDPFLLKTVALCKKNYQQLEMGLDELILLFPVSVSQEVVFWISEVFVKSSISLVCHRISLDKLLIVLKHYWYFFHSSGSLQFAFYQLSLTY